MQLRQVLLCQFPCPAGELRAQALASPLVGSPPFLKAKGPDVPFWCGGPITFELPPAPEGYELAYGVGLFLYSRYNCSRSECEPRLACM